MEAEVFVLEADAGGVAEGQAAGVIVEATPEVAHPAKVTRVEAVAKPRFRGSPVQYFGVVLAFDGSAEADGAARSVMKPGHRVRVTAGTRLAAIVQAPPTVAGDHRFGGVGRPSICRGTRRAARRCRLPAKHRCGLAVAGQAIARPAFQLPQRPFEVGNDVVDGRNLASRVNRIVAGHVAERLRPDRCQYAVDLGDSGGEELIRHGPARVDD